MRNLMNILAVNLEAALLWDDEDVVCNVGSCDYEK